MNRSHPVIQFLREGGPVPWWRLGWLFILAAALPLLWFVDPASTPLLPSGLLTALTPFECPACGMTRASHAMLHGEWARALYYNPLAPAILAIFLTILFFPKLLTSPRILWTLAVAATLFTIWRNL